MGPVDFTIPNCDADITHSLQCSSVGWCMDILEPGKERKSGYACGGGSPTPIDRGKYPYCCERGVIGKMTFGKAIRTVYTGCFRRGKGQEHMTAAYCPNESARTLRSDDSH